MANDHDKFTCNCDKCRDAYDEYYRKEPITTDYPKHIGIASRDAEIDQLKKELHQQRFNNAHNLSIDQKVSDEIANLKLENEILKVDLSWALDKYEYETTNTKYNGLSTRVKELREKYGFRVITPKQV